MNKLFSLLMAGAMIAFASCTKEQDLASGTSGQEVNARIAVQMPSQATKTRAAFVNPDLTDMRVVMAVMYNDIVVHTETKTNQEFVNGAVAFDLRLVTGKSYKVAVWADFGASYYTVSSEIGAAPKVALANTTLNGSDNKYDAYFKIEEVAFTSANEVKPFVLKRPFGLVKINTTDNDAPTVANAGLRAARYQIASINAPTELSLVDGTTAKSENLMLGWSDVSEAVGAGSPKELSFDYFLAGENQSPLANFTVAYKNADNKDVTSYEFTNIPIRRNYITNITGNILTKLGKISVTVDPMWDVTEVDAYTFGSVADLNAAVASIDFSKDVHITLDNAATGEIDLSAVAVAGDVKFLLNKGISGAEGLTIKAAAAYAKTIAIVAKGSANTKLTIDAPAATASFAGQVNEIVANVSQNTLILEPGSRVANVAVQGNTRIEVRTDNGGSDITVADERQDKSNPIVVDITPESGCATTQIKGDATAQVIAGIVNVSTGKKYATVKDAVKDAKAGETIEIAAGEYEIAYSKADANAMPYYLLIDKSLTLKGNGKVLLYSEDDSNTGNWNGQNFITVKADNVKLQNLTIQANYNGYYQGPNKTIEVYDNSNGFVMDNCILVAGRRSADAGSLYIGSEGTSPITATVKNSTFNAAAIGVRTNATVAIENCIFNGIRPMAGWLSCIGVRGNATVKNSTFNTAQTVIAGEEPVVARGNGIVTITGSAFPAPQVNYCKAYDFGQIYVDYASSVSNKWINDRTAPASWAVSNNVIEFSTKTAPANDWYAWHGKKTTVAMDAKAQWSVSTALKIDNSRNGVRQSVWLAVKDANGETIDWAIVGYKIDDQGNKTWEWFDGSTTGVWNVISSAHTTEGVCTVKIAFNAGKIEQYIDNVKVNSYTVSAAASRVDEIIFNSYSFGDSYPTTWAYPTVAL